MTIGVDLGDDFEEVSAMLNAYNAMSLNMIADAAYADVDELTFGMTLIHRLIMRQLDEVAAAAMAGSGVLNPRNDAGKTLEIRERFIALGLKENVPVAEISQALNIRRPAVERIIGRLKGEGQDDRKTV